MNLTERLQKDDLLEPLTFEDGEIEKFIANHVCACGSHLIKFPAPGRKWYAKCPTHGKMIAMSHTTKAQWAKADQAERAGKLEMRSDQPKKTAEELLKDFQF